MQIRANGLDLEVEDSANLNPSDTHAYTRPAVLLLHGLGMQLIAWPQTLVEALIDAGYRVLRIDARDTGLSARLDLLGTPSLFWSGLRQWLGLPWRPPYTLQQMAQDALGVLDALDIDAAHVVGVSMGGMVAQRLAACSANRCLSLTSIMSSSGAPDLPLPRAHLRRAFAKLPRFRGTPEDVQAQTLALLRCIESPAYPSNPVDLQARVAKALARSHNPQGLQRQMLAVMADDCRAALLAKITSPTLVVHGLADPLLARAHGQDTARRIGHARLLEIEGMGHDLPEPAVLQLLDALVPHLQNADQHARAVARGPKSASTRTHANAQHP